MEPIDVSSLLIVEPAEEYHAKRGKFLTSHLLADFRKCPDLYRRKLGNLIPDEDRPAYRIGRATHTLILEGEEAFQTRFALGGPINPRTGEAYGTKTKAFAEWLAEQGRQDFITDAESELCHTMNQAVQKHPLAPELLSEGAAERVVRIDYWEPPCQARLDWIRPDGVIVDLKTCDDLQWFESDARRYGYAHQLAFYRSLFRASIGYVSFPPAFIIAVEKKEPFRCGVWQLSPEVLAAATRDNDAAIKQLQMCQSTDVWPTGYEEVRIFDWIE